MSNKIIEVQNIKINVTNLNEKDFICISDIAKAKSDNSRAADLKCSNLILLTFM